MAQQDYQTGHEYEPRAREADGPQAREIVNQAQQKAGQVVDQAQEKAKSQLDQQKGRAAEGLGSVAYALRTTGEQMRDQQYAAVAEYTDKIAERIDDFSMRLRDKNIDEIMGDVENFARRQPALFVGGAFALGFLATRFIKSSSRPRYDMVDYPQGYSPGSPGSPGMSSYYGGIRDYSTPESERTRMGEGTSPVL